MKALLPGAIRGPQPLKNVCRAGIDFAALDRRDEMSRIRLSTTVVALSPRQDLLACEAQRRQLHPITDEELGAFIQETPLLPRLPAKS